MPITSSVAASSQWKERHKQDIINSGWTLPSWISPLSHFIQTDKGSNGLVTSGVMWTVHACRRFILKYFVGDIQNNHMLALRWNSWPGLCGNIEFWFQENHVCVPEIYNIYDSLLKATLVSNHTYIQYASHPAKTLARLWSVDMHNTRFISPFFSHFENRTSIAPTFPQHMRLWHIQWSSPCTARALPRLLSVRKRGENHFRGDWGQLLARDTSKIPLQTHKCANAKVKRMCGSILYYWVLVQHTLMPSQNHVVIAKLHFFSTNDKVNRCLARYSPGATTTNRPTNRAPNKPAWPCPNWPKMTILGQIWSFLGKKSFFLLEKSKVLLPT